MANFLITSPSSETVGTNSNDLFVLLTAQGASVFGLGGDDLFSAVDLAGSAALLNAGAGNDTIILTATTTKLFEGNVFAGSGNDGLTLNQDFSAAAIRGGSGNDTITLQALAGNALDRTTIGGNDNADLIQGSIVTGSNSSFFAAGKGADTIDLTFSGVNAFTINAGAGHDSVNFSAAGSLSSFHFSGGDGFDTINFSAGAAAAIGSNSNINGGDLNDLLVFSGAVETIDGSAFIGGGAGADTIQFVDSVGLLNGYINAGAGLDSVYISADFSAGTLNGGAGQDSIRLGTFAQSGANGGVIFGDLGADSISLGTQAATNLGSGETYIGSGASTLGYASFDQSNLAAFDNVSAGVSFTDLSASGASNGTQTLFSITQDVVDGTVAASIQVSTFQSNAGGFATFTSTFSNLLTARVAGLDLVLAAGQSVVFQDGAGTNTYVFMQGGAVGSGTDGDLLVQVNNNANSLNAASVSSLAVNFTATYA